MYPDDDRKLLMIMPKHFILMCWFMWLMGFFIGIGVWITILSMISP